MPKKTGTAGEFILDLLAKQPDLEWRVAEIVQAADSKWNDKVVYNTLTKLLAAGKVKKTVADRQTWWGIARPARTLSAKVATPAPAASAAESPPVPKPSAVAKSDKPAITATEFVVSLLTSLPEREWRIAEIVDAGGQEWSEPNIYKSLARLSANGKIQKTIKGRTAWWSAMTPAKKATPARVSVPAAPPVRVVKPAAVEEPAPAADAATSASASAPAASATKPGIRCATASAFVVKLLRRVAKELLTRVADGKKAAPRTSKR